METAERAPLPAPPAAPLPGFAFRPVVFTAAATGAVLTLLSGRYGFHRDELYFLAAGNHPALSYTDQPPLTPLIARASTAAFGENPAGLRVAATLTYVLALVVTGLIARELRGGARAQALATACTAVSAFVLAVGHMVSTATFDLLVWLVVCLFLLRLLRTADPRWWLAVGAAVGVGAENKDLVVVLAVVLVAALAISGPRQLLHSWWPWAGGLVALALAVPDLWWQARHGWPQLTVAGGISSSDGTKNRFLFIPMQIVYLSPVFVPIWVAGWRRLRRDPAVAWARSLALAYPLLCVAVVAAGGKGYYTLPLLVVLLAAGCDPALDWAARNASRTRGGLLAGGVLLTAAVNAVISLPVLPPGALGPVLAVNPEQGEQVGWPALVSAVQSGWQQIPDDRRATAVLFAENYGEAGALAWYGSQNGLPRVYSGHMAFADWGRPPDSDTGPVLVVHQKKDTALERNFTDCVRVATVDNGHGLGNQEQHAVVSLCAGPARPWSALWPHLRHYY